MTSRSDPSLTCPEGTIEQVYRTEWGRLLSLLVRRTRRLDLVEDALGEAFARAASRWPAQGIPANPSAWLYTVAHRMIVGRLRAEAIAGRKAPLLAVGSDWVQTAHNEAGDDLKDERLQLILLCCHPALPGEARSALALRLVIGTPTDEIARLFLVPTATMAARLTRAKKKIVAAGIPLGSPARVELRSRLDEVCRTVYLAFTAGYTPGTGPALFRTDLAGEAVRLAVILHQLTPDAPQTRALLAVLLLHHARRDARVRAGQLVILPHQDRSLWRHDELQAGLELAGDMKPSNGYAEELRLQALIAVEHARAPTATDTDWAVIAELYASLEARTGSPIVRLNRAVAVAETEGPAAGLALLAAVQDLLPANHRVAAVRAELAERAGHRELARAAYQKALELCGNHIERTFLAERLRTLDQAIHPG
jgi:RNA polymerase sigma-70 factor (ECF subfamily)